MLSRRRGGTLPPLEGELGGGHGSLVAANELGGGKRVALQEAGPAGLQWRPPRWRWGMGEGRGGGTARGRPSSPCGVQCLRACPCRPGCLRNFPGSSFPGALLRRGGSGGSGGRRVCPGWASLSHLAAAGDDSGMVWSALLERGMSRKGSGVRRNLL